jgi:hypothetical protein
MRQRKNRLSHWVFWPRSGVTDFLRRGDVLVRDIRVIEKALGDGVKRVYPDELPAKKKLWQV